MTFVSFSFFVFVAVSLLVYFQMPQRYRWIVLLAVSLLFYVLVSGVLLVYLLLTAATTYAVARRIDGINEDSAALLKTAEKDEKKAIRAAATKQKRRWLAGVTVLNFGLLAVFKYQGMLSSGFSLIGKCFGVAVPDFAGSILMPLGVSFYTFQSIGYVIDTYRGKVTAERNFAKYLLFVSFFPQIVQGPIARYDDLAGQLYAGNGFDYQRVKFGAQLAAWGVFKKLVIADRLSILVGAVFNSYPAYTGRTLWMAVLFYTIQIYADFSGGIDIARGVGEMFGVTMAQNFERPYFSQSIAEFWRRWHMTLGGWCRDYIFYPLSLSKAFNQLSKKTRNRLGNRIGKLVPVILSQLIVFIIIGMWHGSQFKYIAFGLYHGAFIIGGILFEETFTKWHEKLHINPNSWWYQAFRILRTFLIVALGRFFSRAGSFMQAMSMLKQSFFPSSNPQPGPFALGMGQNEFLVLIIAMAVLLLVDILCERNVDIRAWIAARPMPIRWALYLCGVVSIVLLGVYGKKYDAAAFIYMRF